MHLGDQRAGGINHAQGAVLGFLANGGGDAVGAENEHGIGGDFLDGFDEDRAAAAKLFDHVGVVYDLVVDVDGRAIGFEGEFHNVDCATNPAADPAGRRTGQSFVL